MDVSDSVLVGDSLAGNLGAFDDLMVRYQGLVFKIAMTCVRDRDVASDITQNVFLKAYQRLATLRRSTNFKAWIARIAYHESLNWLNKHRHERTAVELPSPDHLPPAPGPNQEDALLANETAMCLVAQLRRLNRRQQLAVWLRYFEDMSIGEIASVLRCSETLVKNILFRSLQRLRNTLVEDKWVHQ